jgi:hypothetical protein
MTSALDEGELSVSLPVAFTLGKEPTVPIGYEAGLTPKSVWRIEPKAGLEDVEKRKILPLPGFEPELSRP